MISWIKRNKILVILFLVVSYFIWDKYRYQIPMMNRTMDASVSLGGIAPEMGMMVKSIAPGIPTQDYYEPVSDSQNRLVIQNSNLSLVVNNVREVGDKIIEYSKSKGGFMVDASYNRPDESSFGTITVRVPTADLDSTLDYFRGLSVKVTNEYIQGTDVTEQYTNIDERLVTLEKTKAKYEEILNSATDVQDILQVQQQIIYLQDQIDSYTGQKIALEKNAELTKVTAYLSSDELSLPYAPDNKFRPNVIFKLAVRSLFGSLQNMGEFIIWASVYSLIWIPVLVIVYYVRKYLSKKV